MTAVTGGSASGRHRGRQHRSPRTVGRHTVRAVAATVSLVLFAGSGIGWYNYRALDAGIKSIHVDGLGGAQPDAGAQRHAAAGPGRAQNILIVGDDSRAGLSRQDERTLSVGTSDATTSTDTIMLVHIPAGGRHATLMSIPRDSYVTIPGHPKNKINAAYIDGYDYTSGATTEAERQRAGADLLISTVKQLTGVPIDHYVQIGFSGFEKVVQAVGHITVNLCHPVDDSVAVNRAHGISGGSGFVARAGVQELTPVRALQFVRQRHNLPGIGDDLGREKRQRYFLSAAFDAMASADVLLNPIKLHNVVQALAGAFVKDPGFTLESFAREMSSLSGSRIGGQTIPTTPGPLVPGVGSVLQVNPQTVQRAVYDAFYGPATPATPARTSHAPATPQTSAPATPAAPAHCID